MTKQPGPESQALEALLRKDYDEADRIVDQMSEREAFNLSLAASMLERTATRRTHALRRGA